MSQDDFKTEESSIPPSCRETMALVQSILDNEVPASSLDTDLHAATCAVCRERIAVAKMVMGAIRQPNETAISARTSTDKIVVSVLSEIATTNRIRNRRRVFAFSGGLAVAACVLLALWLLWPKETRTGRTESANVGRNEVGSNEGLPNVAPEKTSKNQTVRLGDEISRAEQALLDSSKPIMEPAAVAPRFLAKLTDALTRPSETEPEMGSTRISLIDLPDAARNSLQPVTSTAQKAFARLLRDVGAIQKSAKVN